MSTAVQHAPTAEQEHALLCYRTGKDLVIEAAAGSGKTTTLELLARYAPHRRGMYLAFNKSVAQEAQARFSGTQTNPFTVHSLAWRSMAAPFRERLNNTPRFTPWGVIAKRVGIETDYVFGPDAQSTTRKIRRESLTQLAQETVTRFQRTADAVLGLQHVALPKALVVGNRAAKEDLARTILDFAETVWADQRDPFGTLPFKHDSYLKMWQLSNPKLNVDFVCLDEAQDADGLMVDVLLKQDAQRVFVGDRSQAIYGWRTGTMDAMSNLPGAYVAQLSQSFRFGEEVAEEAQKWLDLLGADLTIRGNPAKQSRVGRVTAPDAVICRTNGGAIFEVLKGLEKNRTVGVAGERKAQELQRLAKAAVDLQVKGRTSHPDFQAFETWDQVVEISETDEGKDFAPLVKVVDRFTAEKVVDALERCDMASADLVISTAHIAKGLEWGSVRVSKDFPEPKRNDTTDRLELQAEEARISYVTVTRAKDALDTGALSWINDIDEDVDLY
ncbi:UvrD-helicase domain-containing protein [Leucobacter sp. cx-169]|uniref:UvrD-helicase domain-containing protein n=1 Tax=Leucobacter sp. cx-169 TaxID=2770549 RepID=UPI00165E3017|nr:UvrD-helicase domain-containing protein [Leucobacter sp. cx-169]MBC9927341.1 UvrD-helicase domain-containing protein [Leucobacter sp. cx-169]